MMVFFVVFVGNMVWLRLSCRWMVLLCDVDFVDREINEVILISVVVKREKSEVFMVNVC